MANTLVFAILWVVLTYSANNAYSSSLDYLNHESYNESDKLTHILKEMSDLKTKVLLQDNVISSLKDTTDNQEKILKDITEEVEYLKELSKLQIVRTCEEMSDYGISQSNNYFIDPDGPLIGEAPIMVFCNFTEEGVFTEILHNSEDKIEVEHCHDPGCYSKKIIYEAHPDQIQALIELSDSCEQKIRYDCMLSPLQDEGIDLAFWLDKYGQEQIYWDGAQFGEHSCACHYSEQGCIEEATYQNTCNCDSKIPQEIFDEGKITNMTSLPISELRFGGLSYDIQQGFHTLGRLKCKGKVGDVKPGTCSDLKIEGQFKSGYYNVKEGDDNSRLVFCNMTATGYFGESIEEFVESSEDHFGLVETEIEEINSRIPNLPGKWSGGSYCIFANGACPEGFTRIDGFLHGISMAADGSNYINSAKFGDSQIKCSNNPCSNKFADFYISTCCK